MFWISRGGRKNPKPEAIHCTLNGVLGRASLTPSGTAYRFIAKHSEDMTLIPKGLFWKSVVLADNS